MTLEGALVDSCVVVLLLLARGLSFLSLELITPSTFACFLLAPTSAGLFEVLVGLVVVAGARSRDSVEVIFMALEEDVTVSAARNDNNGDG